MKQNIHEDPIQALEGSRGTPMVLTTMAFPDGTVLSGGERIVSIVLRSPEGDFIGHIELDPKSANILGEELRKDAENANKPA